MGAVRCRHPALVVLSYYKKMLDVLQFEIGLSLQGHMGSLKCATETGARTAMCNATMTFYSQVTSQLLVSADFVEASCPYVSAHQMGTARMGADPDTSVCDPNGEAWDVNGLFVCDGSALPTSIGESGPQHTPFCLQLLIAAVLFPGIALSASHLISSTCVSANL